MQNNDEMFVWVSKLLPKNTSLNKCLSSIRFMRKLNHLLYLEGLYSLPGVYKGMLKTFEAKKGGCGI